MERNAVDQTCWSYRHIHSRCWPPFASDTEYPYSRPRSPSEPRQMVWRRPTGLILLSRNPTEPFLHRAAQLSLRSSDLSVQDTARPLETPPDVPLHPCCVPVPPFFV